MVAGAAHDTGVHIAAIPISFHYRAGYKPAQSRLMESVDKAVSLSIARDFADSHR
ncbi:MAG TPA: hypothetical protein VIM36_04780 [Gemmatimonadaceae bacterium]|jgi:hypothetical protein